MLQVALRIAVWVLVFGIGYLVFGPQLFDSSDNNNPFASEKALYLPPQKPQRLRDLEQAATQRALSADEAAQYLELGKTYQANFWQTEGTTVRQALADAATQRRVRLIDVLAGRGLSADEIGVFFMVLDRDHPGLLDDQD